jgi:serine/threonine protein kinase
MCGTAEYIAPELLRRKAYGQGVDIWSCGVVIYIILCGYAPFEDDDKKELFKKIMQGNFKFHRFSILHSTSFAS